ncbi:MAG: PRC-barrel domain-containing protein [Thermomicrobiales bacterium]|nr:PRC-barrel domain-containing protein [Thermomicrobiales bacterium]MCO5220504.1 PRC-barrel domain-containing protein [Thermomicrobiales bacterium]
MSSNQVAIGDKVVSSDGHGLGEVKHLVVDPAKRELSAFIVDKGIFDRGRVCDLSYVDNVDGNQVVLELTQEQANNLPEWVEQEFIQFNESTGLSSGGRTFDNAAGGVWYHMGPAGRDTPSTGASSFFQPAIVGDVTTAIVSPIEESDIVVGKGTDVYSIDGYKLGRVDEIDFDSEGKISGFSFEKGHIFNKKEFSVSVDDVDGLTHDYVRLNVTKADLDAR